MCILRANPVALNFLIRLVDLNPIAEVVVILRRFKILLASIRVRLEDLSDDYCDITVNASQGIFFTELRIKFKELSDVARLWT